MSGKASIEIRDGEIRAFVLELFRDARERYATGERADFDRMPDRSIERAHWFALQCVEFLALLPEYPARPNEGRARAGDGLARAVSEVMRRAYQISKPDDRLYRSCWAIVCEAEPGLMRRTPAEGSEVALATAAFA